MDSNGKQTRAKPNAEGQLSKAIYIFTIASIITLLGVHSIYGHEGQQTQSKTNTDPQISCLNGAGQAVDWWVILKQPKSRFPSSDGTEYLYFDDQTDGQNNNPKITDQASPFLRTFQQITKAKDYIVWNDQPWQPDEDPLQTSDENFQSEEQTSEKTKPTQKQPKQSQSVQQQQQQVLRKEILNQKQEKDTQKALSQSKLSLNSADLPSLTGKATEKGGNPPQVEPEKKGSSVPGKAHSKGYLARDGKSGFFINHSIPQFPIIDKGIFRFEYPSNGLKMGQHAFCVSTTSKELDKIASMLHQANINVMASKTNYAPTEEDVSNIRKASKTAQDSEGFQQFSTKGKLKILMIAKSTKQEEDIFWMIAQQLKVGIVSETMASTTGRNEVLPPICKDGLMSVSNLNITMGQGITQFRYGMTKDHSKFGISTKSTDPICCFADLNRAKPQTKRGGTALCFRMPKLWNFLNSTMTNRQSCS